MSRESERLVELAGEVGHRLNHALRDVIPPEAQQHLLNAQRELLTAVFLIYEHQVAVRRSAPKPIPARRRAGSGARAVRPGSRGAADGKAGSRLNRIKID